MECFNCKKSREFRDHQEVNNQLNNQVNNQVILQEINELLDLMCIWYDSLLKLGLLTRLTRINQILFIKIKKHFIRIKIKIVSKIE